jgi:cation diffusion facilitator family transporter
MDANDVFRQNHVFLGEAHDHNARKTWIVIAICTVMMVAEIVGGIWFGSVALVADGLHMSTHTGALLIAALAYVYARRYVDDPRFAFGTGKLGDLAAFTSAIVLAMIALLIAYEAIERFFNPVAISFNEAIPIAVVGLLVNLVSAFLLRDDHDHHHGHQHHDDDHDDDQPDHDHDHHHDHDKHAAYRRDNNLRAAFIHIAADVVVSVLVIIGLLFARALGWLWLDPAVGLLGAIVVAAWAWSLVRSAGAVLLDMSPDPALARKITDRLQTNGDQIGCLHFWRVGPGHIAGIVTVVTDTPAPPDSYKRRLADLPGLSHLTIEVERRL